jgi:hypothetical protein
MGENPYMPPAVPSGPDSKATPIWVYLLCAWPLVILTMMIPHGGWIVGGIAFGVNLVVLRSPLPLAVKLLLNVIVGVGAILFCLP